MSRVTYQGLPILIQKDTDTKRYQYRYKKSGIFLIRPSNLFFRPIRHMIQDAKMVKDTGNLKKMPEFSYITRIVVTS